jgi:hypothetical protein
MVRQKDSHIGIFQATARGFGSLVGEKIFDNRVIKTEG